MDENGGLKISETLQEGILYDLNDNLDHRLSMSVKKPDDNYVIDELFRNGTITIYALYDVDRKLPKPTPIEVNTDEPNEQVRDCTDVLEIGSDDPVRESKILYKNTHFKKFWKNNSKCSEGDSKTEKKIQTDLVTKEKNSEDLKILYSRHSSGGKHHRNENGIIKKKHGSGEILKDGKIVSNSAVKKFASNLVKVPEESEFEKKKAEHIPPRKNVHKPRKEYVFSGDEHQTDGSIDSNAQSCVLRDMKFLQLEISRIITKLEQSNTAAIKSNAAINANALVPKKSDQKEEVTFHVSVDQNNKVSVRSFPAELTESSVFISEYTISNPDESRKSKSKTEIPSKTEIVLETKIPSEIKFPPKFEIHSEVEIPSEIKFPSKTEISFKTEIPSKAKIPSKTEIPSKTQVPSNIKIPSMSEIPSQSDVLSMTEILRNIEVASKTEIPSLTDILRDFEIPSKADKSSETKIPPETDILSEMTIPSETKIPSETLIPLSTDIPSETKVPLENKIPSETQFPSDIKIVSETKIPAEFKTPSKPEVFPNTDIPSGTKIPTKIKTPSKPKIPSKIDLPLATEIPSMSERIAELKSESIPNELYIPTEVPVEKNLRSSFFLSYEYPMVQTVLFYEIHDERSKLFIDEVSKKSNEDTKKPGKIPVYKSRNSISKSPGALTPQRSESPRTTEPIRTTESTRGTESPRRSLITKRPKSPIKRNEIDPKRTENKRKSVIDTNRTMDQIPNMKVIHSNKSYLEILREPGNESNIIQGKLGTRENTKKPKTPRATSIRDRKSLAHSAKQNSKEMTNSNFIILPNSAYEKVIFTRDMTSRDDMSSEFDESLSGIGKDMSFVLVSDSRSEEFQPKVKSSKDEILLSGKQSLPEIKIRENEFADAVIAASQGEIQDVEIQEGVTVNEETSVKVVKSIWALTKVSIFNDGSKKVEVLEASCTPILSNLKKINKE